MPNLAILMEMGRKNTNECQFTAEEVGYIVFGVDRFGRRGIAKMVIFIKEKGNKDLREIIKGG